MKLWANYLSPYLHSSCEVPCCLLILEEDTELNLFYVPILDPQLIVPFFHIIKMRKVTMSCVLPVMKTDLQYFDISISYDTQNGN